MVSAELPPWVVGSEDKGSAGARLPRRVDAQGAVGAPGQTEPRVSRHT